MILHHIQTSPSSDNALSCALPLVQPNDTILLSSNAVIAPLERQWQDALIQNKHAKLYLLIDDVNARGLKPLLDTVAQQQLKLNYIDYDQFVELTLTHDKVITW